MKRRKFLKGTAMSAVAVSTTGFISFDGSNYVGDCKTTTDILGPFYRPDAPVRNDLVVEHLSGEEVYLQGTIFHDNCSTPLKNAKVELWHCDINEKYDNESDEYRYRATQFTDREGAYSFRTQMPVPYDVGDGTYRPAHFHLMISAPGYQNLVTQLYFTGDPHLDRDRSSKAPHAKSRILDLEKNSDGFLSVPFNVIMEKELDLDPVALEKLEGMFVLEDNHEDVMVFFARDGHLWLKNEVHGELLRYTGDNKFVIPDSHTWGEEKYFFQFQKDGRLAVFRSIDSPGGSTRITKAYRVS